MEAALASLRSDVSASESLERLVRGKPATEPKQARGRQPPVAPERSVECLLGACLAACRETRKRVRTESDPPEDLSDAALSQYARFTRQIRLKPFNEWRSVLQRLREFELASSQRGRILVSLETSDTKIWPEPTVHVH